MAEHREGGDEQGEAKMVDIMPRMRGGSHSGVYGKASEVDAQDGSSDQLEPSDSQSYRTPAPHV